MTGALLVYAKWLVSGLAVVSVSSAVLILILFGLDKVKDNSDTLS